MKIFAYPAFQRCYRNLPASIQTKVDKQLRLLGENPRHSSLQVKKIQRTKGIWEAKVDIHYRLSFEIQGDSVYLRVGNHDEVLKNP